ncbi:metallophosphoesterase domain-containing protein 1-like [Saccoglossus kowalevskii]
MNVLPDGDVLIHAGDFTNVGRPKEVDEFNEWLGKQPFQYKIVIAGNHELTFDQELVKAGTSPVWQSYFRSTSAASVANIHEKLTDCIYLLDEHINILGFNIYGSPWQPEFCDWGFNLPRGEQLLQTWNKIPDDTDILITHGPPIGHGDKTNDSIRAGCVELLSTIQQRVKPKYHIFGHIHEGYGISTDGVTTYINASICTFNYRPTNLPIIFDLPMQKKK